MKNFTNPIQEKQNFVQLLPNTVHEYSLAVNEFEDHTNKVGFIKQDPDEYSFLQISKSSSKEIVPTEKRPVFISLVINLDDKIIKMEREAYTLFTMIGDVGGFNGAIIILPAYIMSFYSERMFRSTLAKEVPVRKKKHQKG